MLLFVPFALIILFVLASVLMALVSVVIGPFIRAVDENKE